MSSYGQLIAIWDGFESIEVNFFTQEYRSSFADFDFLSKFFETRLNAYEIGYHGSQPRGIGRVVTMTSPLFNKDESIKTPVSSK